jgi:hypothetical protein
MLISVGLQTNVNLGWKILKESKNLHLLFQECEVFPRFYVEVSIPDMDPLRTNS